MGRESKLKKIRPIIRGIVKVVYPIAVEFGKQYAIAKAQKELNSHLD
jgi:hypothetical protein